MNNADVTVYDLQKWLSPLWKGNTVYAETAFILKNALGEIRPKRLAYPVKKIVSVRSFDLQTVYEEGKDYSVNEYGELQVLPEGKIPSCPGTNTVFPSSCRTTYTCLPPTRSARSACANFSPIKTA